jgi:hypothetical protein
MTRRQVLMSAAALAQPRRELFVCGWDELIALDASGESPVKSWSWKAEAREELPAEYRKLFRTIDECKPVAGGRVLITASSDGVALIERPSGRVVFWAAGANAHSAEMLPGGRIAVACSVRQRGGNRVVLFDSRVPEKELASTPLYSGHGVVWDDASETLWALGGRVLVALTADLHVKAEYELPDEGGHDLWTIPGTDRLGVTTHDGVWEFDRASRVWRRHPLLGGRAHVKSVSVHPVSGETVYIEAESPNWWSERLEFLAPRRTLRLPGERLYKARWTP